MKNRIVVLTSSDFPYRGAAESFVRQMAFGLLKNEAEVEVIRFWGDRYNNVNDTPIKCTNYLFRRPFKNDFLKFFETLIQVVYIPFFLAFRKVVKRNEIFLLYGLDRAYFVFPFTLFSKIFRIKTFRVITEIYPSYLYAQKWWRKPNILFGKWQVKYFDRYLSGVIVLSTQLHEMELNNRVSEERLLLIPHFIDMKNDEVKKKVKTNPKTRIGFCGNPSYENGVMDLVIAYLKLRQEYAEQIELLIIGNVKEPIKSEIDKLLKGGEDVKFTGLLTKPEVEEQLQLCDILVNPRRSGILADTGFPTKIGEYFAARKPVVATQVGDLGHYFTDKKELVFAEANNPDSISDALKFLLNNSKLSAEIAESAYDWGIKNLDYIHNSKRLLSFIHTNSV